MEIPTLIPRLELACRTASAEHAPELHDLLARTYQALAAAFELSGNPLSVFAGIYRLCHAFVRLKHLDQAEHAAATAISALEDTRADEPQHLSILGSLHLVLALVHARVGDRSAARRQIEAARTVARQLGQDRNDFNLEFGPTNVEIQAVSTAVELGDAGEALDLSKGIHAGGLSAERQARLLMDMGRAHAQRRQHAESLDCLLRAEELAPEMIRTHVAARTAIRDLVLSAGRTASDELRALAERTDSLD
ncbi:transcriptional regulator [Streptomyces sp. C]|nr:transcriptional regulator [Streptomyces sp. C]